MIPYLQIVYGLIILVSFYAVFKSLVFNLHMFQLNSYRLDEETVWLRKNVKRFRVEIIIFLLSLTAFIPVYQNVILSITGTLIIIMLIAMLFENRQKPQKKKLVYTPRVKRLTVTTVLLLAATEGISILFVAGKYWWYAFLFAGLSLSAMPLYILLANLINKPMELGINRHYLNDAKRMLKDSPSLETIGITGSYGKTSVKFYLHTILREWTDTLVTHASFNTPMGVVKTIRGELRSTHRIFLCEMGAKWVGDIKELCDIVHPQHGIITALGEQHLESFGSKENIIKTKYELADALPSGGRLYVNWDNEVVRNNPPKRPFIKYGVTEDCDYYTFDVVPTTQGYTFRTRFPDGSIGDFETRLLGRHTIINITGAIAAANGFGMTAKQIKQYVHKIEAVPHRMQIVPKNGVTIIDDAFNSNPNGCRMALDTLSKMDGDRILVTPGMVELGALEDELNEEFGREAASSCDYIFLVGEKQTASIRKGILSEGFDESRLFVYDSFTDCMKHVYSLKRPDRKEIVLLENDLPDNY